jgi:hypothetical protein
VGLVDAFSLGLVALVATIVGVFTAGSVIVHKREAAAASATLEAYKLETAGKVADATTAGILAGEKAGHAQTDIDAANVELAKQKTLTANAALKAAEAERQNIELRRKFSSRRLSPEQHRILLEELSKHPATFHFGTMSDPESQLFAADILKTFKEAGWVLDSPPELPLGVLWTNLVLFNPQDPSAIVIANTLRAARIPFGYSPIPPEWGTKWKERTTLMIGAKPAAF